MLPLLVIRPEPGCTATVAAARARGINAVGQPLFAIEPRDWTLPDPAQFDALLLGSANALRHAGPQLAALRSLPAYVVGATTAAAAKAAGFSVAATGRGGLQAVVNSLPAHHQRLLRLAGAERTELHLPAGATMHECVTYASLAQPLSPDMADQLNKPSVVALHSAEAARHFDAECTRLSLPRASLRIVALGPRIAEALGPGWHSLAIAERPDDEALLALAAKMCQDCAP